MLSKQKILEQFAVYEEHVRRYDAEFREKNRLPKNHDWRPYRWCSRDIVFSLVAVRHDRFRNCLEVDVCLMANPPQYFDNIGARVAMSFLLSEAYKCGTTMEIVFTHNVESRIENGVTKGRVPAYIYDLANEMGVKLKYVLEGHITPFEARQMYMRLVGFSTEAQEKVMSMSVSGLLSPERVCFLVLGGIWSVAEAEAIILGGSNPESILLSASEPEDRHLYLRDVLNSRGAVLGGALDRKLLKKELIKDGQIVESEDEETGIEISFDGKVYAKLYEAKEDLLIPWTGIANQYLRSGELMVVTVRARTSVEIQESFQMDLGVLETTLNKYMPKDPNVKIFYLVPRDFEDIPENEREVMKKMLEKMRASIMMSPESVAGLDKEAIRRIETGRMIRHE